MAMHKNGQGFQYQVAAEIVYRLSFKDGSIGAMSVCLKHPKGETSLYYINNKKETYYMHHTKYGEQDVVDFGYNPESGFAAIVEEVIESTDF